MYIFSKIWSYYDLYSHQFHKVSLRVVILSQTVAIGVVDLRKSPHLWRRGPGSATENLAADLTRDSRTVINTTVKTSWTHSLVGDSTLLIKGWVVRITDLYYPPTLSTHTTKSWNSYCDAWLIRSITLYFLGQMKQLLLLLNPNVPEWFLKFWTEFEIYTYAVHIIQNFRSNRWILNWLTLNNIL